MMASNSPMQNAPSSPTIFRASVDFWKSSAATFGSWTATGSLASKLWEFLCDSTPSRLRQRYGDTDYDWDYRVNTTSAAVGWRDRLLGVLYSPYQPTEPSVFREMLDYLKAQEVLDLREFTFLDVGSGKGRTLLMASDYPFRRIVGVELLPNLDQIARENIGRYKSESQQCFNLESICGDATHFPLPPEPLLLYLFNPFPESGLRLFLESLRRSMNEKPRPVYLLYHNAALENVARQSGLLQKLGGTHQYSVFKGVT
jgi:SAM-dependent methyltransferase